ncbi:MAG: hypothetical protein BWY71_01597 [Planctomycetes bacterium ADurb.Bin412]|nr:MAG: hypothetical protein BWY71_01597 [Planctomycetes bacterium ADurb.Bin412]
MWYSWVSSDFPIRAGAAKRHGVWCLKNGRFSRMATNLNNWRAILCNIWFGLKVIFEACPSVGQGVHFRYVDRVGIQYEKTYKKEKPTNETR